MAPASSWRTSSAPSPDDAPVTMAILVMVTSLVSETKGTGSFALSSLSQNFTSG